MSESYHCCRPSNCEGAHERTCEPRRTCKPLSCAERRCGNPRIMEIIEALEAADRLPMPQMVAMPAFAGSPKAEFEAIEWPKLDEAAVDAAMAKLSDEARRTLDQQWRTNLAQPFPPSSP